MAQRIGFTLVQSTDPLNKLFKSDGTKISRGQMYSGSYKVVQVNSIEELFRGLDKLQENQAITLGVTNKDEGFLTTSAKVKMT